MSTLNFMRIYLDHAATTPLDETVEQAMRPYHFFQGNASSVHTSGREARFALENARDRLASTLACQARELIFTSGGTEANHMALLGVLAESGGHLVTTAIEHSAVLGPARWLAQLGRTRLSVVPSDASGVVNPQAIEDALASDTRLVSVMHVNNEIGTVQPIREIAELCRERNILLHVDAVQSFGWLPLVPNELGADLLSLSAHKFYGPKGVGALWVRRGITLTPSMLGGGQEGGRRAGTHNLPGIVGMSIAAERVLARPDTARLELERLRNHLAERLTALPGVTLNGRTAPRSPKHVHVTADGVDGETLLMNLDLLGIDVSSGSACSAGSLEPSHVLLAMGQSPAEARAGVRFSLGFSSTAEEIERAGEAFAQALERSRLD